MLSSSSPSTPAAPPSQNHDEQVALADSPRLTRHKLLLLTLLCLLTAVAVWANADALRRWQFRNAATDDLLRQARRQPHDLLLTKMSGQRLLEANRAGEAREILVPMADAHPQDAELNVLAGRAEWQSGSSQKAGALFKSALEADPANTDARYWTAELLYRRGRKELAEELMLDATRLDPDRGDIWLRLGEIALRALDYEVALQRLEQAERLTPSGQVAWLRASALHSLGRLGEAETSARAAVARDPRPESHILLAEIIQASPEEARQREARQHLQRALEEAPTATNALKLLAINYRTQGEHVHAVKVLRRLLRLVPAQTEAYLMLSQSYRALGKHDLSSSTLSIFRRLEPLQAKADYAQHRVSIEHGSLSAQLQQIRALMVLGRYDLAREVIERARGKNPDHPALQSLTRRMAQPPARAIEPLPPDVSGDAP